MAGNDKLFVAKNGLRTQNIEYLSPDRTNTITQEMLDSDTLSWEGNSGQLFSITDSLTGTIFSVNDISGIPSIEVDDDGTIRLAEFAGNVLVGTNTDDGTNKLQVSGSVIATSFSGDLNYSDITNPPTIGNGTITINAGGGLSTGGAFTTNQTGSETITIDHANTSSQGDVNNSGGTVVQDIFVDTYGHITSIGSKTLTAADVGALGVNDKADDSDLLDGLNSSQFLRSDTSDTFTGSVFTILNQLDIGSQNSNTGRIKSLTDDAGSPGFELSDNFADLVWAVGADDRGGDNQGDNAFVIKYNNGSSFGSSWTSNGSEYFTIDALGNIGIGSPSPSSKLDVNGSISATSFSGSLNYSDITNPPTIGNGTLTVSGGSGINASGTFSANQTANTTISVDHADTSSQGSVNNSGSTVIQDVTLDGFGHITGLASKSLSASDVGALGVNDKAADSNLFDGLDSSAFLQSESDTLDSVTDRGNSTSNTISAGEVESDLFFRNKNTVSSDRTVPNDGYNSMSVGPITISSGTTITIADGARWVVV